MEKLPEEIVEFILSKLDEGQYEVADGRVIIQIAEQKEKFIYPRKNGRYQVIITDPETRKRITVGSYTSQADAIIARDKALGECERKQQVIALDRFRQRDDDSKSHSN